MSHSAEVKNLWENSILDYDIHMEETGHYEAQRKLLESLTGYIHSPILDLASGPGYLAGILLEKEYDVTLNDFSTKMVSLTKEKYSKYPNAQFENMNAEELALNERYRTIICCNLFYYLENREKAVKNWIEHLAKDGSIILLEEYPFQRPVGSHMNEIESELMRLIDPISLQEIKKYFGELQLIKEIQTPIDQKHSLYAFVFSTSTD